MECTNDFLKKGAPRADPAFESALSKYKEGKQAQEAFQQAKASTDRFKNFLGHFKKETKDKDIKRFDISQKYRWEDVQSEANAALESYSSPEFTSQPMRYLSRSFTENASTLEAFLDFVPDGEYTFIICGALTLVFNAAKRVAALRKRILDCLEGLSKVVAKAKIYREIYRDDPDLRQAAETLYIGILNGIEAMLSWMDESAFKKTMKSIFKQDSYGKSLEDKVIKAGIEDCANEFREFAEIGLHKRLGDIDRRQENMEKLIENLTKQLSGQEKDCQWRFTTPHAPLLLQGAVFIDVFGLQRIIGVDQNSFKNDMQSAITDCKRLSSESNLVSATNMMQNERFIDWLKTARSDILLVNGFMNVNQEQEGASPLTAASCVLYGKLVDDSAAFPLLYLCGQHVDYDDPYRGPTGMLRFLIAQLLYANPVQIDTSRYNYELVRGVETYQNSALFTLLQDLLVSLPRRAIFIIIDGLSLLEGSHLADLQGFVQVLLNVTEVLDQRASDNIGGPVLKVLFTFPTYSVYLSQWIPESRLDLMSHGPRLDLVASADMHMGEHYDVWI